MPDQIGSDAKVQLEIAEYQPVAGLIEYFREVELNAWGEPASSSPAWFPLSRFSSS